MNTLLYWNVNKRPLAEAVTAAKAAHVRRLGCEPTNVILPEGSEYPPEVGGLKVETSKLVKGPHLKVYATEVSNVSVL